MVNSIYRWLITLTLGANSTQLCPICCVPQEHLDAIDLDFQHCNTLICRETYEMALLARREAEANCICKVYGRCKVKVCLGSHGLLYKAFLTKQGRTSSGTFFIHNLAMRFHMINFTCLIQVYGVHTHGSSYVPHTLASKGRGKPC